MELGVELELDKTWYLLISIEHQQVAGGGDQELGKLNKASD